MENIFPTGKSKILVCLALSPRVSAVAREAYHIARLLSAELYFLHVGEDTQETRLALEEALRKAFQEGGWNPPIIRAGKPDRVICDVAEEMGVDLIVAGALEKEGLIQGILGSVARRIARYAPCSVLLLTEPDERSEPFQTIVASVQYDEVSSKLVEFALELARRNHTRLLHVVHEYDLYGVHMAAIEGVEDSHGAGDTILLQTTEELRLTNFVERFDLQGLRLETACLEGREGQESVEYARRHDADLLLLPAPPRPLNIWDRFFNHPTEFILQKLPCALLLYRHRLTSR